MKKNEFQISYSPLWKMLIEKDIKKSQLHDITRIAPSTFTKMSKNEMVSLDVLARICIALDCNLDNIVCIKKGIAEDECNESCSN